MINYTTAFFDLDGTLVDNYTAIWKCLCASFKRFGVNPPTYEAVYASVGGSILITITKLLPPSRKDIAASIGEFYMTAFHEYIFDGLKVLPYVEPTLSELKSRGVKIVCFTNKQQDGAEAILAHLRLEKYFDAVIGTTLHSPRKPSPEFTNAALEKMGVSAAQAVGIGDSPYDYQAAAGAGMKSALVATGADSMQTLLQKCPDCLGVFADMRALAKCVFDIAL